MMSVSRVAEVDANSGCLRKVTDTEKVIAKIAQCITGAEAVPFMDTLLLTAQTSQRVLKIVLNHLPVFVTLLTDNALDREVTLRTLAIPRMGTVDGLIIAASAGEGAKAFSEAIKKLIEDTIDPVIRKQAIDISGELDALLALASPPQRAPLTKEQLVKGLTENSLCLKCDSVDHHECDLPPAVCLNCRGDRSLCIRGCAKACRVCGLIHAGRSIIACLDEIANGPKKRKLADTELDEEPDEKRMRSTRDYKEARRRHKEEKKTTVSASSTDRSSSVGNSSTPHAFEKLLKDTVAKA